MNVKTTVIRGLAGTRLNLKRHAPTIMTVTGAVGFTATVAMSIHATLKAADVIPEIRKDIQAARELEIDEDTTKEAKMHNLAKIYGESAAVLLKIYGPTLLTGSLSVALVLSGHGLMKRREASLVAAYAALDAGYRAYRQRIVERLGEEEERSLYRGVKMVKVNRPGLDGEEGPPCEIADPLDKLASPYGRFFDEFNVNYSKTAEYNHMFLKSQEAWANDKLRAHGYLFLNEVYEALGMDRTQAGQIVGWKLGSDAGDGYVSFGIENIFDVNSRAFVNDQEPIIFLDFNVDGVIGID
jgi:hypothetical protein